MKYFLILFTVVACLNCSPKLSPDSSWGRNRWVLIEMRKVPVQLSGGRRDAFLNFDPDQKRYSGNGGCNQISGSYTITKKNIHFGDVMSTKMSCDDIAFENSFLSTLNNVDRYEIKGNDLLLKRRGEVLLVLSAR